MADHHTAEKGTENTVKEEWSESTGALECCSSTCLHLQDHGSGLPPYEAPVMIAEKRNFSVYPYRIMMQHQGLSKGLISCIYAELVSYCIRINCAYFSENTQRCTLKKKLSSPRLKFSHKKAQQIMFKQLASLQQSRCLVSMVTSS